MDLSNEDSLKVTEQEDGTFLIEWDGNDPTWSIFNGLSQEEMESFFTEALRSYLIDLKESENVSIYDE